MKVRKQSRGTMSRRGASLGLRLALLSGPAGRPTLELHLWWLALGGVREFEELAADEIKPAGNEVGESPGSSHCSRGPRRCSSAWRSARRLRSD